MPLYDYRCTKCGKTFEIRRSFDETRDEACPDCGAPLTRVFNAAPIVFKGSGFYVTDSRKSPATGASKPAESSNDSKPDVPAKTDAPAASNAPAPNADAPKAAAPKASDPAA